MVEAILVERQSWALEGCGMNTPLAELRLGSWCEVESSALKHKIFRAQLALDTVHPKSDLAHITVTPLGFQCQGEEVGDGVQTLDPGSPGQLGSREPGCDTGSGGGDCPESGCHFPIGTTSSSLQYCHAQTACGK